MGEVIRPEAAIQRLSLGSVLQLRDWDMVQESLQRAQVVHGLGDSQVVVDAAIDPDKQISFGTDRYVAEVNCSEEYAHVRSNVLCSGIGSVVAVERMDGNGNGHAE